MAADSATPGSDEAERQPSAAAGSSALSSSVRRGALWSIASTLSLRLGSIAVTAVVARILDPRDFGIFAVALTALWIVTSVGELGVASCLIRADLDLDELAPTMVSISLLTSVILAAALVVFARPIAAALGSAAAAGPVKVMAIAAILGGLFAVPNAQLARDFRQDKLFLSSLISFVPSTIVLLVLARSGSGAMAFAWSRVVGQAVAGFVLVVSVSKNYRPGFARSALATLFKFGFPLGGANFINYVLLNVDYAFVGHLMGAIALGVYVLAFNVASWPSTLLGSMITGVSMPAFSRVKHDAELLKSSIAGGLRALSVAVMPICGLTIGLARPIILTMYGAKWGSAASVLSVLSFYGAVSILCLLFANILAGLGRSNFLLIVQLIWLGALVPAMAVGVHEDGIVGAAFAHIAVIGPIVLPIYLIVLKRLIGIRFRSLVRAIFPATLAASIAAFAAMNIASRFAIPVVQLAAGLVVGSAIYAVATAPLLIGLLNPELAARLGADRILRVYGAAAHLVGLPTGVRRHSAPSRRPGSYRIYYTDYYPRPGHLISEYEEPGYDEIEYEKAAYEAAENVQTLQFGALELQALLEGGPRSPRHVPRHARGSDGGEKR